MKQKQYVIADRSLHYYDFLDFISVNESALPVTYEDYYPDYVDPDASKMSVNFSITFWRSGCFFWNETSNAWITAGCKV